MRCQSRRRRRSSRSRSRQSSASRSTSTCSAPSRPKSASSSSSSALSKCVHTSTRRAVGRRSCRRRRREHAGDGRRRRFERVERAVVVADVVGRIDSRQRRSVRRRLVPRAALHADVHRCVGRRCARRRRRRQPHSVVAVRLRVPQSYCATPDKLLSRVKLVSHCVCRPLALSKTHRDRCVDADGSARLGRLVVARRRRRADADRIPRVGRARRHAARTAHSRHCRV